MVLENYRNTSRLAFASSKVLTVLGVFIFCLLFMVPVIVTNINEKIYSEREVSTAKEITRAMERMKADGLLNKSYYNTDAFVDELQKYLKIEKRCHAENMSECWYDTAILGNDGVKYHVSDITYRDQIHLRGYNIVKNPNVGLVLKNGVSLIFSYDDKMYIYQERIKSDYSVKSLPIGWGKTKEFSYTSSVTKDIDFIMDVNGAKGPNRETSYKKAGDIRSFKKARVGADCPNIIFDKGKKITGLCLVNLGKEYSPFNCDLKPKKRIGLDEKIIDLDEYICSGGKIPSGFKRDYWAGAKVACAEIGLEIPMISNMHVIATLNNKPSDFPSSGWFWSDTPSSKVPKTVGRVMDFSHGYTRYFRKDVQLNVLCSGI